MSFQTLPASITIEAEMLRDATLSPLDMAYMNFAREEHKALEKIILCMVIPATGPNHPVARDLRRHLEQTRTFSGNFCWQHRHLGHMHDAVNVGGVQ